VLFDLVILILTISKIGSQRGSSVGYLIYRDSLIYFILTTVTNIVVLVIQSLGPSFALTKAAVLPFSTIITATMGVRVFLNLRLFHQRDAKGGSEASTATGRLASGNERNFSKHSTALPAHPEIPMETLVVTSEGPSVKEPQGPFYYTRTSEDERA
jgi:hypothetical protein